MSGPGPSAPERRRLGWIDLSPGWSVLESSGPLFFTTRAMLRSPEGKEVEWTSRRHRKRLGLRAPAGSRPGHGRGWLARPSELSVWMGGLFMAGSLCFALGSVPLYFDNIDAEVVAGTFFVGSIFFTAAAYLQFREAVAQPTVVGDDASRPRGVRALVGWRPRGIDWWAGLIQLGGTVFFNVSTFAATRSDLSVQDERRLIWAPDVLGSICFLVASWLAYSEVSGKLASRPRRSIDWWICGLNLAGSIAFGAAAIGARYLRTTGEPANIALVNLGTFVGAVCFFAGAALLPVESAHEQSGSFADGRARRA